MKIELKKTQNLNKEFFYKVYLDDELVFDSVIYAGNERSTEKEKGEFLKKAMEIYENIKNKNYPTDQVLISEDI